MSTNKPSIEQSFTRRDFVKSSAAVTAASIAAPAVLGAGFHNSVSDEIRVGLIGCGGRGTGAAHNALDASEYINIVALADVFEDRLNGCRDSLTKKDQSRASVSADRCYLGFDAYKELLASDLDMVILATPPHFRPIHFEHAIKENKHVFMEKPVAVDPVGIRRVIEASKAAAEKSRCVVAGTQRRHEKCYLELIDKLGDGAIGKVVAGRVSWNQQGLWVKEQQPSWSDMEWHIRNWLYFTWLSGDHICEQHIRNLDVANWVMGGTPVKCLGLGGRQVRTGEKYGQIFDHFAVEYEYEGGRFVESMCRQINGCASRVSENFVGDKGHSWSSSGWAQIHGENAWRSGKNNSPYVQEHKDLVASIRGESDYLNEGRRVAESTLTAIMGRMSTYTGKEVTWEQAMNSKLDLTPPAYEWSELSMPEVAIPGTTPLI